MPCSPWMPWSPWGPVGPSSPASDVEGVSCALMRRAALASWRGAAQCAAARRLAPIGSLPWPTDTHRGHQDSRGGREGPGGSGGTCGGECRAPRPQPRRRLQGGQAVEKSSIISLVSRTHAASTAARGWLRSTDVRQVRMQQLTRAEHDRQRGADEDRAPHLERRESGGGGGAEQLGSKRPHRRPFFSRATRAARMTVECAGVRRERALCKVAAGCAACSNRRCNTRLGGRAHTPLAC